MVAAVIPTEIVDRTESLEQLVDQSYPEDHRAAEIPYKSFQIHTAIFQLSALPYTVLLLDRKDG